MSPLLLPLHLLLLMFAGWLTRHQLEVMPDTLLRWYRDLVAFKWNYSHRRRQRAIGHYVAHYHTERNHQGLGNRLLQSEPGTGLSRHSVLRRQRLGGMLNYYHRAAA